MIQPFVELRPGSRTSLVEAFLPVEARTHLRVPLVGSAASCGFPSPSDDYLDKPLDFNELLIENPAATFAVRMAGESMTGAGLFPGDIAIVDRSRTPRSGSIVLALVNGEFTIKRYRRREGGIVLGRKPSLPGDPDHGRHPVRGLWRGGALDCML